MSTKQDAKYAAKRRASIRKRNRELIRQIGIYLFIGLIVLGTISTAFVVQVGTSTSPTVVVPTPTANLGMSGLVTQADAAIASGDYKTGIGLYLAYLAASPDDADVNFKVGKAYLDAANTEPDYAAGLEHLQRSIAINPSGPYAAQAQVLIDQFGAAAKATIAVLSTASIPVSGTASLATPAAIAPTVPVTSTSPITP